jgi:hypothetical protein
MNAAPMGVMRNVYKVLLQNLKGIIHLQDLDIKGKTILKLILKKHIVRVWTGYIWLKIESNGRLL